ncbi:hypothetical protein DPMN_025401 [Dreissena polymorpha]|uniref:Uncharacterized protein n=1 Tax=Dreissena polymorpha TaxID=45954 RepID=A0A9D4LRB9_DREPO|nr:hypothetical protein DPMN_025401 [Dreissena polymorpha]
MASILSEHILKKHVDAIIGCAFYDIGFWARIQLGYIYVDILKIVPEPTMTNQAPLSLMNRLKKPIELSVSQSCEVKTTSDKGCSMQVNASPKEILSIWNRTIRGQGNNAVKHETVFTPLLTNALQ